jgi:hypothetical protein
MANPESASSSPVERRDEKERVLINNILESFDSLKDRMEALRQLREEQA